MSNDLFYLTLTLLHIIVWIILYRFSRGATDCFDSFYLVSGLYILIFCWAPSVWLGRGQTSYQGVEIMEYLPIATLVFNIGYAAYAVGSIGKKKIVFSQRIERTSFDYDAPDYLEYINSASVQSFILRYAWLLFLGSMALVILYYKITGRGFFFMLTLGQSGDGGMSDTGLGIYFMAQFTRSAIPGVLLLLLCQDKHRWAVYLCLYVLCAYCISSGSRNLAICAVLAIVVSSYIRKGKRPSLIFLILMVVGMYMFVGFIGIFRQTIKAGEGLDLSLVNQESLMTAFMYNVEIFYPFYTLVGYVKGGTVSLHYGLGIINILIQFIPRALWSSKPENLGQTALEAMYGSSMGGAAYPNIGEFYYEFGLFGAVLGMFIFGYIMRRVYEKNIFSENPIKIIIYSIAYGYMMQFVCRGHFASWGIDLAMMFVPLLVLQHLLKNRYLNGSKGI